MSTHSVRGHWRNTKSGRVWVSAHSRCRDEGYQLGNPANLIPTRQDFGFKSEEHFKLASTLATKKNVKKIEFINRDENSCLEELKRVNLQQSKPKWFIEGYKSERHLTLSLELAKQEGFLPYQYKPWTEKMCEDKISYNNSPRKLQPEWKVQGFSSSEHYRLANLLSKNENFPVNVYKNWTEKMCNDKLVKIKTSLPCSSTAINHHSSSSNTTETQTPPKSNGMLTFLVWLLIIFIFWLFDSH